MLVHLADASLLTKYYITHRLYERKYVRASIHLEQPAFVRPLIARCQITIHPLPCHAQTHKRSKLPPGPPQYDALQPKNVQNLEHATPQPKNAPNPKTTANDPAHHARHSAYTCAKPENNGTAL